MPLEHDDADANFDLAAGIAGYAAALQPVKMLVSGANPSDQRDRVLRSER
jgi:hypothetical protein